MGRLFAGLIFLIALGSAGYWMLVGRIFEPSLVEMNDFALMAVARGPILMASQRLREVPPGNYPNVMQEFHSFEDLLRLRPVTKLGFSDRDLEQLRHTPIFLLEDPTEISHFVAYHLIPGTEWVLLYGPIPEPEGQEILDTSLQLGWVVLACGLLLVWLSRLYAKSLKLEEAARAFGRGSFSARTGLANKGFMGNLGHTFDQMATRIETLLQNKNDVINAVSHELRTPLSRLAFAIHFLKEKMPPGEQMIADIEEESVHLQELVSELLRYGQIDYQLSSETWEPQAIIPWLNRQLSQAQKHDPNLQINVPPVREDATVRMIPVLLEKVISNLLMNAQTHRKKQTCVSLLIFEDRVQINVADDGPGILPEQRSSALKPFVRLQPNRTRDQGGWGLGLNLAQKIVTWHQGQLAIEASDLGGAEIQIKLPIHT